MTVNPFGSTYVSIGILIAFVGAGCGRCAAARQTTTSIITLAKRIFVNTGTSAPLQLVSIAHPRYFSHVLMAECMPLNRLEAPMSLQDAVRSQLIEIIEWTDDSRETLSYRFPDEDKEIKRGAKLIVRESQAAQFVYLGQFGDLFRPGQHTLTTANLPLLTRLQGWKYGFESPFKADVYFVTTRLFTGNKWGTSNPVMVRDQDFGVIRW